MKLKNGIFEIELPSNVVEDQDNFLLNLVLQLPERNITEQVSEWAERKRIMSSGLSARPGPFNFDVTPYLREIVDCLSDMSEIQIVDFMKSTQIGATSGIIENHQGYCVEYGIGPGLFVSGDATVAEESMEKRFDQMIQSAGLQHKIKPNIQKKRQKSTGDRVDSKSFGGTFIRAVGPNSESKLRTFPFKISWQDEADVYPDASVSEKIERRSDSYEELKKIFSSSTPKNKNTSVIEPRFELGDKRYYNFQCPKCKKYQHFIWENFRVKKNNDGSPAVKIKMINGIETILNDPTFFECANKKCKYKILDSDKEKMLRETGRGGTAKFIPTKKANRPFRRSYHVNAFYGFRSWLDIAFHYYRIKDDILLLPDFRNDVLGLTWEDRALAPDTHELMQQAEDWVRGFIHSSNIFLTLAADIQGDRIECSLMGWAANKQAYVINYWNFLGEPNLVESECWTNLAEKITNVYIRDDGVEMQVQVAFIDSQYLKDQVLHFCDQFDWHNSSLAGVYPIIVRDGLSSGITTKVLSSEIKTPVIGLSDQKLKFALYNTLRKKPHSNGFPYGYIHFSKEYGNEFYKQLTSEEIFIIKKKNGKEMRTIENRKQRPNEVFDIIKYQLGAYQFALDRYFYIENKKRVDDKLSPIQPDTDIFISAMEESLYE